MTRKRFIQLVMSHRIQRNTAQKIARAARKFRIPYAVAYNAVRATLLLGIYPFMRVDCAVSRDGSGAKPCGKKDGER